MKLELKLAGIILGIGLAGGCATVTIVTANLYEKQGNETLDAATLRQQREGELIRENYPLWSLIAANEVLARKDRIFGGARVFRARSVDCPGDSTEEKILAIECFERGLAPHGSMNHAHQIGELGIVATGHEFEQIPFYPSRSDPTFFAYKHIGNKKRGGLWRAALASRFKLKKVTDENILFVSTHLSHAARSHGQRATELRDLMKHIHSWYREGELTPILAGDFNCGSWSAQEREVIFEHFFLADTDEDIDHIFIGRPQSFPSNAGYLTPVEGSTRRFQPIGPDGNGLSDHFFISVDLEFDRDKQYGELPPPVTTPGEGCWNP